MSKQIELGVIAKDTITGFQGVVVCHSTFLGNCPRYTLRPREVKDGKPVAPQAFDNTRLAFVESTTLKVLHPTRPDEQVELGDRVRDAITGLEGIATSLHIYIDGCSHVGIQPRELKDGVPVEVSYMDEKDLTVLDRANPKPAPRKTGGPRPEPTRMRGGR